MASHVNLAQFEEENSLLFGLKWSLVGFALALCFLAGCSSMFDERVPRYNTVEGPRRAPPLNPSAANSALENAQKMQATAGAPAAPVAPAPAPVAAAVAAPVTVTPRAAPATPGYVPEEKAPWWDVTSWFDDEPNPVAKPMARVVPQENLAVMHEPAVQAAPAARVATADLPAPVLPSTQQPALTQPVRDTRAEIAELEREMARSNAEREALMKETGTPMPPVAAPAPVAMPTPTMPTPTLPTPTLAATPAHVAAEVIDSSQYDVNYKVVRLPPPPARDANVAAPVVTGRDVYYATDPMKQTPVLREPVAVAPAAAAPATAVPVYTPLPESERAAMAPIELTPPANAQPVDVPMAPAVDYGSPVLSHSAPIQLTPPSARGGSYGYQGQGYLEDSRYSGRRAGYARGAY